ncbi:MAG: methyltransferase [Candidatus Diapherotrites archaeon]|nr:methyltransferase [Candidatus Diapherotrites archaeon]
MNIREEKLRLFDLVPEISPPRYYFLLFALFIFAFLFAFVPNAIIKFDFIPFLQSLVYCALSFLLWKKAHGFSKKTGDQRLNYRHALPFFFFGMCLWYSALLIPFFAGNIKQIHPVNFVAGFILFLIALLIWKKAVKVFSVEEIYVMGSFFPSSFKLKQNSVFRFIRHPFLGIAVVVCFGLFIISPSLFGLLSFLAVCLTALMWISIEEKDLIQRFGKEYVIYQQKTGQLFPKITKIPEFILFLGGITND